DSRLTTIDTTAPAKVPAASEASADGQIDQNPDDGQNAATETRRVEPAAIQSRAGVFVDPAVTAAPPAPSVNANAITNAIAGVEGLRPGTETVAQMLLRLSSSHGGQVQSLKIQLHPAELGVVTAQLNFAGDQLSVELKVENAEAYHRLSMDTETIAKSLRTLGFEVDHVSIQQPQIVTTASARADIGGNSAGSFGRDASSFQSWGSSNGESGTGGQAAGRGRENGGGRHEANAPVRQNSAGSDIYI
ncbi:MAG TPA: flagellar hook-length control protein FliK, partial [Rhizobiaceae bacterium]|nr:flagellar hook-length control protein FliK [Rhizobiaceae bacterium]